MKIAISVSDKEKAKGSESPDYKALLAVGVKPEEVELVSPSHPSIPDIKGYDGVLFTGGKDINPKYYEEAVKYPGLVQITRNGMPLNLSYLIGRTVMGCRSWASAAASR